TKVIQSLRYGHCQSDLLKAAGLARSTLYYQLSLQKANVTNGAIVIHTQRLKSDPGGNLLS
ncbi:hypothetical protein, partial [Escherichia coli]|uniref:hypothetical protein n=1 Tax=Escherichia coli TaxID=562 RepID=UPI001E3D89B9